MIGLQLNHLSFAIRGHALFSDLNAHFALGKIIALAGTNGCGKSTLLSMLAGINQPQHGTVCFDGQDLYKHNLQSRIGYMPNLPCLYPQLTVEENLQWLLSLQQCKAPKVKAARFIAQHNIIDLKNWLFGKLSDGQKKRIQLLAALMQDPDLLILDEPCSLLDSAQRNSVWRLLKNWCQPSKLIIFSTHHVSEVTEFCDDIVFLHNGTFHYEKQTLPTKVPCL